MPEFVQCPQCDRKLRVPDDLLGRKVKCPTCGTMFIAQIGGATSSVPEPPPPLPPPESSWEPEPRPEPNWRDDDRDRDDNPQGPRGRRRSRGPRNPRRDSEPHRGGTIMVLGILSLVTGLGFILGPIAWSMGSGDLAKIRAGSMDPDGESQTNGGMVCGIIGTFIGVFKLMCCCGIMFIGAMGGLK